MRVETVEGSKVQGYSASGEYDYEWLGLGFRFACRGWGSVLSVKEDIRYLRYKICKICKICKI